MLRTLLIAALLALAGCACVARAPGAPQQATPVRFLLSFDDGPAPSTARVLDTLASNPVQPGVKAVFFVQTRIGGETELMRRAYAEGHLLAVHSGTPRGHVSHMALSDEELLQSLEQAKADIAAVTGEPPRFVRPPFWFYDSGVLACYRRAGLAMVLTDVNALDGTVLGVNVVPGKRYFIREQLQRIKREADERRLPRLDGVVPLIATFHDTNRWTAGDLAGYLQMLVEEAGRAGFAPAARPFYDRREDLERAASLRARRL